MGFILLWILFSLLVAWMGSEKTIGFWGAFLVALLLSPVIGFIVVIVSPNKKNEAIQQQILLNQQQQIINQQQQLSSMNSNKTNQLSVSEELAKWKKQKEEGIITEDEYQKIKNKLLAQFD